MGRRVRLRRQALLQRHRRRRVPRAAGTPGHALRLIAALALLLCGAAQASSYYDVCDKPVPLSSQQQDRLFRFAAVVRSELAGAADAAALVARSGQKKLQRFGQRYSHAGISLRASANAPWSVRQLYFACEEGVPRIFDQGIAGFLFGNDDPEEGYVSIVLLPPDAARAVEQRALANADALQMLGGAYSANAYPFSTLYQNCNQWVAELLALAWGAADGRENAQRWLQERGYEPAVFDVSALWLRVLRWFVPWVHDDDQPPDDRDARRYRVSMPQAIEAFVRTQLPAAERIEICHAGARVVVHRGWDAVADGCVPGAGDRVIELD